MAGLVAGVEGRWNAVKRKHFRACEARDLFQVFGCIGEISEVAISPRRNKVGKRFGFARFAEVSDVRLLAVKVDNVIFDGVKIHANVPRFARISLSAHRRIANRDGFLPNNFGGQGQTVQNPCRASESGRRDARSFVEVVAEKSKDVLTVEKQKPPLVFFSKDVDRERLSNSLVGILRIPGSADGIQSRIERVGFFAIRVIPLGASMCLLEETEVGSLAEFSNEGEEWWQDWFTKISAWKKDVVDTYRTVWLRFWGIPEVAWNSDFFNFLANLWGSLICVDAGTADRTSMAMARIKMKVVIGVSIPKVLEVLIDGCKFSLEIQIETSHKCYCSGNLKSLSCLSKSSDSVSSGDLGSEEILGFEDESIDSIEAFSSAVKAAASISVQPQGVVLGCEDVSSAVNFVQVQAGESPGSFVPNSAVGASVDCFDEAVRSVGKESLDAELVNLAVDVNRKEEKSKMSVVGGEAEGVAVASIIEKAVRVKGVRMAGGNKGCFLEAGLSGVVSKKKALCPKIVKFRNLMELGAGGCLKRKKSFKNKIKRKVSGDFTKKIRGGGSSVSVEDSHLVSGFYHSGCEGICYENLSENDLIGFNNSKQWEIVNKYVEVKMRSTFEGLGMSNLKDRLNINKNKGELEVDEHSVVVPRKEISTPSL
ncbi:uncharacterized protein LOC131597013 [Vicia villosa]|uniref:uncharacterized protein LOC131597013 n=1 Tax=Vicia villosa TaxID=3911 RepID=UPI00273AB8E3|nr:uncharacterized protein LOC131597013 [Vicia villosa]